MDQKYYVANLFVIGRQGASGSIETLVVIVCKEKGCERKKTEEETLQFLVFSVTDAQHSRLRLK